MPGFSNPALSQWPGEKAGRIFPPNFHPDGVLGGLNLGAPGADMDAWAKGTHSLGPLNLSGGQPKNRAESIGDALGAAETAVDGMHGIIEQGFETFGGALPGDRIVLKKLPYASQAIAAPLALGAGIAHTFGDVNRGVPVEEAILGNAARTGLVYGSGLLAGAVPYVGPIAGPSTSYWMDQHLPTGSVIGHNMIQKLSEPYWANALLSIP